MIDKIRAYLDHAFEGAPQSKTIRDLKEELSVNLIEKYNDELQQGKTQAEAYDTVINSIGDIDELIRSVREPYDADRIQYQKKRALVVSISVMLFILSAVVVIIFATMLDQPILGTVLMLVMVAIAAGMMVYINMIKPPYYKNEDSMVEDFKQWRYTSESRKAAYNSFNSALWSIIVAVYLIVSFVFRIWAYSWIIFIIGAAIQNIVRGVMQMRSGDHE